MDAVQADRIWIRLPGDLIVLTGQVFHAAHLTPQLIDVTDLTDPTDALKIFNGMLRHSLRGRVIFSLKHFIAPAVDSCELALLTKDGGNKGIKYQKIVAVETKFPPIPMSGSISFVDLRLICPNHELFWGKTSLLRLKIEI